MNEFGQRQTDDAGLTLVGAAAGAEPVKPIDVDPGAAQEYLSAGGPGGPNEQGRSRNRDQMQRCTQGLTEVARLQRIGRSAPASPQGADKAVWAFQRTARGPQ